MLISPPGHLADEVLVPEKESLELAFPPQGLGMMRIAFFPLREDGPEGMELAMLAQKMAAAQRLRPEVPYPQGVARPQALGIFSQSARNFLIPTSVRGWATICFRTPKGTVATWAPALAASTTWRGLRTLATMTSVSKS